MSSSSDSPVEAHLDELLVGLSGIEPRRTRHLLAEAEAHLRDAVAEGLTRGLSEREAEVEAVRRFGGTAEVAGAERRTGRVSLPVLTRATFASGLLLGGIGAVAVGLSGAIAALMRLVGGVNFLVSAMPGKAPDPVDCPRWLSLDPGAHSCAQAALGDWANETVFYRLLVGILGLLALACFAVLRRRWRAKGSWLMLPPLVIDTIAASAFGLGGLAFLALGANAGVAGGGRGIGQWLSAAVVALPAALVAAGRVLVDLRRVEFSRSLVASH